MKPREVLLGLTLWLLIAGSIVGLIWASFAYSATPASTFADVERRYQQTFKVRDSAALGGPVEAWRQVNLLVDAVYPLTPLPEAHAWLSIVGHRLGSLLIYHGDSWKAVCAPNSDGDGCREWVRCGRHAFGLIHLWESQRQCVLAGLRPSQFPCVKAKGLAQVALRKLRQERCVVPPVVELWP